MKSLLNALQEGRLIELSTTEKDKALEYLARLIEAIPDIGTNTDLVKAVKEREAQANTGLGKGIACPHVRTKLEGDLLCAVGWSPEGIEYNAPDGQKVHLIIMYYIPDSQKNLYLKEISGLAKVIIGLDDVKFLSGIKEIQTVREKLLDWVGLAIDKAIPDSKAKMIKLEMKQATLEANIPATDTLKIVSRIIPFSLIAFDSEKYIILSNDMKLVTEFEKSNELLKLLNGHTEFSLSGYKVAVKSVTAFAGNRKSYDCFALL